MSNAENGNREDEEMSDSFITKHAIADALKQMCTQKPFDKISIADITGICKLNRQSFYYHFQDKYELLSWIYYNDCFILAIEGITFDNWDNRILYILKKMKAEKNFYMNTIKTEENIFREYLYEITNTLFHEAADVLDTDKKLNAADKTFFSEFFAYGVCGVVINWAKSGMEASPEKMAKRLRSLAVNTEEFGFKRYCVINEE